ncbi:MAG: polymer-forming cytoskeletal protein [Candidatus Omnitrophota bacterium]|nr:polymer-forming cytoskeletal protein [Candidatus Omnitrophota bacterium]MBU2528680.1 polymer-forming cytoskeletal protein [bacterium]MBU3929429.1 polymer-forming cytoskeletal protein [bacterium]MBU4123152.1 polymer-forming cytoskeletal protein [bacterium]
MFGSNKLEKKIGRIETVIGHESVITGTIATKGSLKIDGLVNGGIEQADAVIIGDTGKIIGDVTAQTVIVSGEVEGNIHSYISMELMEDGKIKGDIKTSQITINEGAFFEGNVTMEKTAPLPKNED